jgi:DNA (cytosine-5)-methyltransferase 1
MLPTHLSLFTGIAGIDIAAEWAGFETIGQCEIDPYCIKVLEKHFPDVKRWKDVKDLNGEKIIRTVGKPTLISGGFPCQPHSTAGKRKASCDDRDLWPELRRILCEVRPRWFLGENVAGLRSSETGQFFGNIIRDLAAMGYSIGWGSWEAADVGACHHRERVFVVAHLSIEGIGKLPVREWEPQQTSSDIIGCNGNIADSKYLRCNDGATGGQGIFGEQTRDETGTGNQSPSDTQKPGLERGNTGGTSSTDGRDSKCLIGSQRDFQAGSWEQNWYEVAARLCRMDDGVPRRVDRLRCLGNAVVPQQVYPILKVIADIEKGAK